MKFINTKTGEELAVSSGVILSQGYFSGNKNNMELGQIFRQNNKYYITNIDGGLLGITHKEEHVSLPRGFECKIFVGDVIHRGKYSIKIISG